MIQKQESNLSERAHLAAERAIDELRRQSGVVIGDDSGQAIGNYPVEFLDENRLSALRSKGMRLLLSAARARTLGLGQTDIRIDAEALSLAELTALSNPVAPQTPAPALSVSEASAIDSMALKLAKYASLLPALLLVPQGSGDTGRWLALPAADLREYIEHPVLDVIATARASLPIEGAEHASIVSFRARGGTSVHLALIVGDISATPLTRIHSSCVTGDLLGSLRCDCGDQLKLALDQITEAKNGLLIYLHQEGRGIGITNKLRAYQLQERGIDTYDANLMLGFEEDERDFGIAAAILEALGVHDIRLLTNNPHKMAALEKAGIRVKERVPLIVKTGRHNHAYLEAKGKKAGHLL